MPAQKSSDIVNLASQIKKIAEEKPKRAKKKIEILKRKLIEEVRNF